MSVLGNPTKYQDFPSFVGLGDGAQTSFQLSWNPGSKNALDVWVGGSIQTDSFVISGSSVVFSSPPAMGEKVVIKAKGNKSSWKPNTKQERKVITPTDGQTIFSTSPYIYQMSTNNVAMYVNGSRWVIGVDFEEVTNNTVRSISSFHFSPTDTVELVIGYDIDGMTWTTADSIAYKAETVYSALDRIFNKSNDFISLRDFDVVGDGISDDTIAIQSALSYTRLQGGKSKKLLWNSGTYKITSQLTVGTNQYVEFEPGVTVNLIPESGVEYTSLFAAGNQSNITFLGNGATINGTVSGATAEGNAAAFYLYGTDNVYIRGFNINNMATDGITLEGDLTRSGPCQNVTIHDVNIKGSRRNNLSPISVKGLRVIGGNFDSAGTDNPAPFGPWAGIDLEPNDNCYMEDVILIGVNTSNNSGAGIQITPGALSLVSGRRFDVTIIGGKSTNDGSLSGIPGLYFVNGGSQANKIYGSVTVQGFFVDSPKSSGVLWRNWDADKCPNVLLDHVTVINPDYMGTADTNIKRAGFVAYSDPSQSITNLGNIIMRDCLSEDTRTTARMTWGFIVGQESGKATKNIRVENPKTINQVDAAGYDVNTYISSGTSNNVDVFYSSPRSINVSGSTNISGYGGSRINVIVSATNQTLPSAVGCVGMHWEIQNDNGIDRTTIVIQPSDTILWYGLSVGSGIVLDNGGYMKIRSAGPGVWRIEEISGNWHMVGQSAASRITYGTSSPAVGVWSRGDRVINALPSVGQPKSWVCTASGSPGTWVSEGNL
jgi:hypothetical protein